MSLHGNSRQQAWQETTNNRLRRILQTRRNSKNAAHFSFNDTFVTWPGTDADTMESFVAACAHETVHTSANASKSRDNNPMVLM